MFRSREAPNKFNATFELFELRGKFALLFASLRSSSCLPPRGLASSFTPTLLNGG